MHLKGAEGHPEGWYCGAYAKTTGRPCRNRAGFRTEHFGYSKCYLHGGLTPIKHGLYSNWFPQMLADNVEAARDLSALEHAQEALAAQAAIIGHYAKRFKEGINPTAEDLDFLQKWLSRVAKTAEQITKIRHQQALTVGETLAIFEGWARIVEKYVDDPEKREALGQDLTLFVRNLAGPLGEERGSVALSSGEATTPHHSG